MFWGLQLEPGKHYSQNVSKPFHITHAAIGSPKVNWLVSVRAVVNDNDYVLCYLGSASGKEGASTLQQSLNLEVAEGEEVVLYTQPTSPACKQNYSVHLTGYYADDLYTPTESDILEAAMEEEDPDESYAQLEDVQLSSEDEEPTPKKGEKRKYKKEKKKNDEVEVVPKKRRKATPTKTRTKGGTEVDEVEEGTGRIAKPGKKVFVKYTGRLASNNRIFDSNMDKQKPFIFHLGKGEVIKGWDEGVHGMKVGGKRKLTIPPNQGYGSKGAPPQIPPNSTLVFDIQLIQIK